MLLSPSSTHVLQFFSGGQHCEKLLLDKIHRYINNHNSEGSVAEYNDVQKRAAKTREACLLPPYWCAPYNLDKAANGARSDGGCRYQMHMHRNQAAQSVSMLLAVNCSPHPHPRSDRHGAAHVR